MDDLSSYKALYFQTAREYVQSILKSLGHIEKSPETELENIHRYAHSLKSQSTTMKYHEVENLSEVIERIFGKLKDAGEKPSPKLVFAVQSSVTALSDTLDALEKNTNSSPLTTQIENLQKFL